MDPANLTKAERLLVEHLSPTQRADFLVNHQFVVFGSQSGRPYRICYDLAASNVRTERHRYCTVATVPRADLLLSQKLLLETNEREFLRTAVSSIRLTAADYVMGGIALGYFATCVVLIAWRIVVSVITP